MADTLGALVDKLCTVDLKMWDNQEILYEIRRMDFNDFKERYWAKEEGAEELWSCLKKACDLNVQRNQIIDEIDAKVIEIVSDGVSGKSLDEGKHIQRKHKTY